MYDGFIIDDDEAPRPPTDNTEFFNSPGTKDKKPRCISTIYGGDRVHRKGIRPQASKKAAAFRKRVLPQNKKKVSK